MSSSTAGGLFVEACCLTLVRGLAVDETFARLGADTSSSTTVGFAELVRTAYAEHGRHPVRQVAGAAPLDGWTLVLEPNGYVCSGRRLMARVSLGTTTVTLYHSEDDDELTVMADGHRSHRLHLPPGCRADAGPGDAFWEAGGAALLERYSGIRLSARLVHGLRYRTGSLALP